MAPPVDPIMDTDLQAYVDEQLPVARRIEVEAHLCVQPEVAARIMADLKIRNELRLALADVPHDLPHNALASARRLERGLRQSRITRYVRQAAAVVILIGFGWFAHAQLGVGDVEASVRPPAYIADAVRSHRTTALRAGMKSQFETPDYDAAEIRAATAIVMPAIPTDWTVLDVQVFPSTFGPSVEVAARTPRFGNVSLFAVRPGSFDVVPATATHHDEFAVSYWQTGEVAYVLVGKSRMQDLEAAAADLSQSLY